MDSTSLLLLGLHFVTFTLFHWNHGKKLMSKLRKSEMRSVVQETFKGYGKGLNLISLVHKAFKLQINAPYFVLIVIIRGSASALFKAVFLHLIVKKPLRLKKAKINLLFITIPTIIMFIAQFLIKYCLSTHFAEFDSHITHFFITFMVISRCMRQLMKILKSMKGKKRSHR